MSNTGVWYKFSSSNHGGGSVTYRFYDEEPAEAEIKDDSLEWIERERPSAERWRVDVEKVDAPPAAWLNNEILGCIAREASARSYRALLKSYL